MPRKTKPWKRNSARLVDCRYEVWRVGELLWLRGNCNPDKIAGAGFRFSPNHQAYWIRHDSAEKLPEILQFPMPQVQPDKYNIRSFVREQFGKIGPDRNRNGSISEEFKLRCPQEFKGSLKGVREGKYEPADVVAQLAWEANLIEFPEEETLYQALADKTPVYLTPFTKETYKLKSDSTRHQLNVVKEEATHAESPF